MEVIFGGAILICIIAYVEVKHHKKEAEILLGRRHCAGLNFADALRIKSLHFREHAFNGLCIVLRIKVISGALALHRYENAALPIYSPDTGVTAERGRTGGKFAEVDGGKEMLNLVLRH